MQIFHKRLNFFTISIILIFFLSLESIFSPFMQIFHKRLNFFTISIILIFFLSLESIFSPFMYRSLEGLDNGKSILGG